MRRPCTARFACWPAASGCRGCCPTAPPANRRLLAAYLDRPLIPENFSADECLDPWSGRSLDDWWTFYEGGTRLVEYLNHAGYNGLMLAVLADGSTIYPSTLLAADAALRHGRVLRHRPRTRSARTCWRCCCGCSTARTCN